MCSFSSCNQHSSDQATYTALSVDQACPGRQGRVHKGCQLCMIKNHQVVQHPELETQGRYCSKFCSCLHSCVHYELKFFFHLTLQGLNCGIIARKMSFNLLSFLLYLAFSCNFCLKINCPIYSGNNYHDDVEVSKTHPSNMTHLALQGQNMNFYL